MAYPQAPTTSEDPADWLMHCDILQDAGASRSVWQRSKRVADSLLSSPSLILLRRVGTLGFHTWEPPLSRVSHSAMFQWFRPEWCPGFLPSEVKDWVGTPQRPGSRLMCDQLLKSVRSQVVKRFFLAHSARLMPSRDELWRTAF